MKFSLYKIIRFLIALVWVINGIYAKFFGMVPRHEEIVAKILQTQNANIIILIIGILEVMMAIWIFSGRFSKVNAIFQSFIILLMNILEFSLAPELLLWGKMNLVFAILFVILILWNEFYLNPNAEFKKSSVRR